MKIVRLNGGLGNQMFQYAFAKELELLFQNEEICLYGNNCELYELFDVNLKTVTEKEVKRYGDISESPLGKIKRHYFRKKTHLLERDYSFNTKILQKEGNIYYDGYWQTEKYFTDIKEEIPNLFSFKKKVNKKNLELVMVDNDFCSIHIRRGDYTKIKGYDVIDLEYYKKAINIIKENSTDITFLVFSNDIEWCKEKLPKENIIFIDWNTNENSWQDLWLMTKCKYNIIANSTFSWWGAYLSKAEVVIAPKIWMNRKKDYYTYTFSDIIPEKWKKI